MPSIIFLIGMLLTLLPGSAMSSPPATAIDGVVGDYLLNDDWMYYESASPEPVGLERLTPVPVNLPHSWNSLDATDAMPGYRRSASWYRKQVVFSHDASRYRHFLYFEGANMRAEIHVNGQIAGEHVGGYLGFEIEITELLDFGNTNEILVRVDNSVDRSLIPSQKADFVLFGGLTRDVFLQVRPGVHIDSIQIDTPEVSATTARVVSTVQISSNEIEPQDYSLELEIRNPDRETVSKKQLAITAGNGESSHEIQMPPVESPRLWSPDSPELYTLEASLKDPAGQLVHQSSDSFGLRWFEFNSDGAFMLNGQRVLLRGTHRHEEHAGYGAAMPNELHVRDMEMIKEIGANFVRLGHYPQDPSVYAAADRLGLILWDELPWCRGGVGDSEWKANTERMLREMIAQNRNHPSVFFWSLGNEIYWLPDYENGGDEALINEYLQHLQDVAKELDPGRLTALRKHYSGADIVDVFSPSIWAGWYGGGYHQYEDAINEARQKYPRMLHMEYGGSSHVGRYDPSPPGGDGLQGGQVSVAEMVNQSGVVSVAKGGDWSESYIVDLFDWHLGVSESLPQFAGNAQWAFKDFATPLRPENSIPYMNQKGLVDRAGRPKEAYWVFRSRWTHSPAFCHLYGERWTERQGTEGDTDTVRAYCNTESAELIHNGHSLGIKTRNLDRFPAAGLTWEIPFQAGMNSLEVRGFNKGTMVATDSQSVEFFFESHGKMSDLLLSADPLENGLVRVNAVAVDTNGRTVTDSRERVYFGHSNAPAGGRLIRAMGTPDGSSVIELANGKAEILFEPSGDGETAIIEIRSQNHKGSYLEIN